MELDFVEKALRQVEQIKKESASKFKHEAGVLWSYIEKEELKNRLKETDAIIAGGAIRSAITGEDINDVDIYFRSMEGAAYVVSYLIENSKCVSWTNKSGLFAIGSGKLINIIWFKEFSTPDEVFKSFDFTCVMGAMSCKSNVFTFHDDFFVSNMSKRIRYSATNLYPMASIFRIDKYRKKGFKTSKKELAKIMVKIIGLNISTVEELQDQLGTLYGINLEAVFKDVKEFNTETILEKLDEIECLEEYEKPKFNINTDDKFLELFEKCIRYEKIGKYYIEYIGKFKSGTTSDPINDNIADVQFPIKLYKYVKKTPEQNEFVSFYKNTFKYTIGEEVVDNDNGIWIGFFNERSGFTHKNEKDKALIEIEVASKEDIMYFDTSATGKRITKGTVVRVVEEE